MGFFFFHGPFSPLSVLFQRHFGSLVSDGLVLLCCFGFFNQRSQIICGSIYRPGVSYASQILSTKKEGRFPWDWLQASIHNCANIRCRYGYKHIPGSMRSCNMVHSNLLSKIASKNRCHQPFNVHDVFWRIILQP
jgi:hypothetical protein